MEGILEQAMEKADPEKLKAILKNQSKRSSEESNDTLTSKRRKTGDGEKSQINRYSGWSVPSNKFSLPKVDIKEVSSEEFYNKFVRRRKPVVITGNLKDIVGTDKLQNWKSFDYLKSKAGEETVVVEKRDTAGDSFGKGNEVSMKFKELLDLIADGDSLHYLTTQDVEANMNGRPDLMAPFMKKFKDDFPLRPPLMGNLVPQNINVWMGNNADGASSGLHHDYHDNLYIVLKGQKHFRLFSPCDTEKMYTRGTLLTVHPNGRINYEGEETTAYGADMKSDAAANASSAKEKAEKMLAQAEEDVENGIEGAQKRLEEAEEAMDAALEALLDAEADDEDEDGNEDGLFQSNNDYDEEEDDESDDHDDYAEDAKVSAEQGEAPRLVDKTVKDPNNFSRVSPDMLDDNAKLKESFPLILEANAAFCQLEEGDCLYLPASWFHEVRSFGGEGGHMALNYWFHPPDMVDDYHHPYTTEFWPNDFNRRFDS